jgi:hypothetical protein
MIAHHRFRLADDGNCAEIDSGGLAEEIDAALASISPAATPVSEAGGEVTEAMIYAGCSAWVELYPAFEGEKPQPTAGDVVKTILIAALAKPAASPAGGDVREAVLAALRQAASGGASGLADHEIEEIANDLLASLSQSTSPGGLGNDL